MAAKANEHWYRSTSLWVAVMFVVAAGAVAWFGSGQSRSMHQPAGPAETLAGRSSPAPGAAVGSLDIGGLPTRVVVPDAGIDAPIAEVGVVADGSRTAWETAWHAVGHHYDSSLPGQPGNMVLTGHVSVADRGNAAFFSKLDKLAAGDAVEVYSGDQVYHYAVSSISTVAPNAVKVLRSSDGATVTLITCTHDLKNRLVVVAKLV